MENVMKLLQAWNRLTAANADAVAQKVEILTQHWRNGPTVKVVRGPAHLPVDAPDHVRGLYTKAGIWLVASGNDADSVAKTLAHEAIAHHGLRRTQGQNWRHFMRGVRSAAVAGDPVLKRAQDYVRAVYVNDDGEFDLRRIPEADEICAELVESRVCPSTGRLVIQQPLRKQAMALAGRFRRDVLHIDGAVCHREVEGELLLAERHLRRLPPGTRRAKIAALWRRCYSAAMPKPSRPPMSLAESEALLKAERQRTIRKGGWWAMIQIVGGLGFFLWLIGYLLYAAFTALAK